MVVSLLEPDFFNGQDSHLKGMVIFQVRFTILVLLLVISSNLTLMNTD